MALTALPTHIPAGQWQLPTALAAVAAVMAFAWQQANVWVQKFIYEPYDHQEKD